MLRDKWFIIGLVLSLSLLWPLVAAPYFTHHDDVQIIRLFEMNKCIQDNQIPCRWVPDLGGLYGYPLFNYYAPLPYYYGEIFYLLTGNLIFSAKVMFATAFIGSFLFMYLLGSKIWGNVGGSLSAVFYSFAPYHSVDFYVRGAMGELWGLMFFPAILWSLYRLSENVSILNFLLSAALISLLIIAHNLSAMVFLPIAVLWVLFLFSINKKLKFLWYSLFAFGLGLFLSAFYLLPVIVEQNLVHVETTTYGYFSYTEHFKGLRKLFLDQSWGWGASVREVPGGAKDGLSFQIGWVHLAGWILALVILVILWKKQATKTKIILFSTLFILLSIFMINPRSEFIWKLIPQLKYIQFPWRFLMIIIFFISFVSGSAVLISRKREVFWGLIFAVVILNFSYFRPERFIQTTDKELLSGKSWDRQIKRSIFDYLPIYAKEPPAELATTRYQILTGDTKISNFQEGTNWMKFNADTKTHTIIRLSQYYFPDWKITVNGVEVPVNYKDNSLGLMTFILGKGKNTVEVRLYDTQVRLVANFISFLGFAGTSTPFT
ncbi:MAG: 6-pyruvoyl-tetrahydropterin synthase-related protein, partial [Patescibacteria group bacterium]|nr:6-pyruvoyl-tetrahydropterin synthase-related protein [Patescibacteria group bacterium]